MKSIIQKITYGAVLSFSGLLVMSSGALAQNSTQVIPPTQKFSTFQDILGIINTFLSWIFTLLLVLAAIFIILAAFYYLTAGGDEEKISKAKGRLIYAVVAIAIGLVATSVRFVVEQLINSKSAI